MDFGHNITGVAFDWEYFDLDKFDSIARKLI